MAFFIPIKFGILGLIIIALWKFQEMSPYIKSYLMGWAFYVFLSGIMDLSGQAATRFNVRLLPHFNKPFMAASVKEFWGHRWNMVCAMNLRDLVYGPIMEGKLVAENSQYTDAKQSMKNTAKPSIYKTLFAQFCVFLASGLIHQLIYWYFSKGSNWGWCLFFVIQCPIMVAEHYVKEKLKERNIHVPKIVRIVITNAILCVAAGPLFFEPFLQAGALEKVTLAILGMQRDLTIAYTYTQEHVANVLKTVMAS